jgi:VCBS repeat-containing protein
LDGSGVATYTTSALSVGTHPITATYSGAVSFEVSTSNLISQVVDTPPVATSDSYTLTVNTTLTVTAPGVLANDTDAESQTLTAVLDTDVLTGTLDLHADGSFVYTPPQDYTGVVTFTYHATDGYVNSNVVQVTLTVQDFTVYLPLVLRNY